MFYLESILLKLRTSLAHCFAALQIDLKNRSEVLLALTFAQGAIGFGSALFCLGIIITAKPAARGGLDSDTVAWLLSMVLLVSLGFTYASLKTLRPRFIKEKEFRAHIVTLSKKAMLFDTTLKHMSQGLCLFDRNQRLIHCNDRYARMYGLTDDQVKPGTPLHRIVQARIACGVYAEGSPVAYLRERLAPEKDALTQIQRLSDGRSIFISRQPLDDGGWIATHEDITQYEQAAEQMAHMACHDPLTNLANRTRLTTKIEEALEQLQEKGEPFSIFMLDLDHFKFVNDSLGHAAGDALLKMVAQRLLAATRDVDIVARLGGDEFAILQKVESDQNGAAVCLGKRLQNLIEEPFAFEGQRINVGTSIGIAQAPQDGCSTEDLLKKADLALYKAKSDGRHRYHFFDVSMEEAVNARRALEEDIRVALLQEQFEIHYQPVIDLATESVSGVEALIRWNHPVRGWLAPKEFISLSEENNLIVPLGDWIIRKVFADACLWPETVKIRINLSPVQIARGALVDTIAKGLQEFNLSPKRLELEVTEAVLLQKSEDYRTVLMELKDMGISISLDDFCTGYSSLSYLQMFPFDRIKIDKSFVAALGTSNECAAIVCAVIGLGRSLNIKTTAEGVETPEQLTLLRFAGCHEAQGHLFGMAGPVEQLNFSNPKFLSVTAAAEPESASHEPSQAMRTNAA